MNTQNTIQANIWKLCASQFLRELMFFIPILVPFWSKWFSMQQIFMLEAAYSAMLIVFEIPSGYFADIFGRKKSLIIGSFLGVIGMTIFIFSSTFIGFLIGEIILGIGGSFVSGAEEAIVYETLLQEKQQQRYKKAQGNILLAGRAGSIISNISGPFLAIIFLRLPFYATFLPFFLCFLLSFTLQEPVQHTKKFTAWRHFKTIFKDVVHDKKLFFFIIFASIPPGFFFISFWLYQKYMQFIDLPLVYFGIVIAAMSVLSGIGSKYAQEIETYLTPKLSLVIVPLLAVLTWLSLAYLKGFWALPLLMLTPFLWGFFIPVFQDYIQKMASSDRRATLLSLRSLGTRSIFLILGPFLGYITDAYSIQTAFFATAMLFMFLGGISLLGLRRVGVL